MQIAFPFSDFGEPYEKDYEVGGAQFTVRVLNMGKNDIGPTWLFMILVKGHQIEGGPYNPRFDRELTDENVANQLASFWGHTKIVQDAQDLLGTPEWELDAIIDKCAAWMHGYFIAENFDHTDYDIISKFICEDDWVVVLRPNYMPNRLVEFHKEVDNDYVEIHSYIEDNELSVQF